MHTTKSENMSQVKKLYTLQEHLEQALEDDLSQMSVTVDYYTSVVTVTTEKLDKLITEIRKGKELEKYDLIDRLENIKNTLNW